MGGVRSRGDVPESPVNSAYPSMMRLLAAVPSPRHSGQACKTRAEQKERRRFRARRWAGNRRDPSKWGLRS